MESVLILIRLLMQEKKINSDEFARSCEFTNLHPQLKYSEDKLTAFFDKIFSFYSSGPNGVLSVVFMEQNAHNQLHGQLLNDYRPTDVITFPADEEDGHAGEICVSVDKAMLESGLRGIPFVEEVSLYLIHGWLHLIGFNDMEEVERTCMKDEEKNCLSLIRKSCLWPDFELASPDSLK